MPRPRHWSLPALAGLIVLLACLAAVGSARAAAAPVTADPLPGISVQGNHLMQNGAPFVPRGVQIVGLVAPDSQLTGKYIPANQHFGPAELAQAVADHVNLIRFQVSEFGLNPADPLYDPAYVTEVQSGIELARSYGLNVIVSLQAQSPAGSELRCPLPDAGAATDWRELAQWFGNDPDIMFELYNEPGVADTPANWAVWKNGGTVFNGQGPCSVVGVQQLVDEIRAAGANNVIILPGLAGEQTLAGHPGVSDPAFPHDAQLAWGIHYPNLTQTPDEWDTEFGDAAARAPVVITEWQANGTTNCVANAPVTAPQLLQYLALKQIGVVGFAFDLPGTIVADYNYTPTTYQNFACGQFTGGVGQTLFGDYAGEAAQAAVTGQGAPASWLLSINQLQQMLAVDPAATQQSLNTPRTFVLGSTTAELDGLGIAAASPAISFTNEVTLAQQAATGALPPGTSAVVLALGPSSPLAEQQHPAQTFALAEQAAQRNGLLLVAEPQLGLVKTLAPHSRPRDRTIIFLRRNLAGAAAEYADAVVLPFGTAQGSSAGYAAVTAIAAAQARAANPGVQIIGGLSVGGSRTPSPTVLASSARAASGSVTGFALSGIPAAGNVSPVGLLQQLYGAGAASAASRH